MSNTNEYNNPFLKHAPERKGKHGFNYKTGKWWEVYNAQSPAYMYDLEFKDGGLDTRPGKMYSPIYKDGTVRHFFDDYSNVGHRQDWIFRFNSVFKTEFTMMTEIKQFISDRGGSWVEFVWFYVSRFLPEVKKFRIIATDEYPINRKKGKLKFWQK